MSNVKREKKAKSLAGERWKMIETPRPTLKMDYFVSNKGRLKSRSKADGSEHILTPTADAKDYLKSSIKLEGGSYGLYVHMAVAKYWSKKPKKAGYNRYIHKDLNRLNNAASNIVWVTDDEWRDYVRARAKKYGYVPHRKGGKPKLTEKQVIQIKKHLAKGRMAKSKIAAKFNVSHTQINRIEAGENWAGLKVEGFKPVKKGSRRPAAKKTAARKPAARKTAAKKTTARKPAAKKATAAKKTTARKPAAKKATAAKKTTARKPAAKKATAAKKTTARKPAAKKATAAKKTTARKPAAKKATAAKKTTARKPAAKKATAAKKTTARKPAAKKATAAKKTTARKPAAKKATTAKKTTARKSSSRTTRKKK